MSPVLTILTPGLITVVHASALTFAALLELVGWAKFDADGNKMVITNFDRHNGSTAKTRALTNKRVKKSRDLCNDSVTPIPLPEKRREEVKTTTRAKPVDNSEPVDNSGALASATHLLASKLKENGKGQWWRTPEGIEARGREMGILAKPGEGLMEYKDRLFKATQ